MKKTFITSILLLTLTQLILAQGTKPFQFETATELQAFFKWTPKSQALVSAHRGGPESGFPENCIETFENTCNSQPSIIECDIAISKDGKLLMMHDYSLDRTTNGTGKVLEKEWNYIKSLKLKDTKGAITEFSVPTLKEALEWGKGKAILMLDVKRGVPFEKVVKEVRETHSEAFVAIITYSAEDAKKVYELAPELMLSVSARNTDELERLLSAGIPTNRMVAFTGTTSSAPEHYIKLHELGIFCIMGTMGNLDKKAEQKGIEVYQKLLDNGVDILATDRPTEAYKAIK
ncbi:glycerophosphodiester phosphodiesterase family protein [Flammeovirgaceae bacterium SG7u.111]|nr:glycerophosphodiester phosphodiesterase family protein [Flammeovirgaceae bacterium SG7u.132]WPO33484.1 glycerophosphodiester phosphodiesterase family protein [Flammeovirgaceae bacterium SG7u.111]